jgi:succinoglycan biosynthesis transport protein ExoP
MRRDGLNGRGEQVVDPVGGELDLSRLASALWRRKRWIIVPTILAGAIAAVYVTLATPQYRSQALVLIENRETPFNRPQSSTAGGEQRSAPDPEAVGSEVQLAQSRDLVRSVVRDLKLAERPEFNPSSGVSPLSALLRLVGLARDPSRMTLEEQVLEKFYERLNVYQLERSRVIAIEFNSSNPVLAAEVTNKVAERLLEFQRAAKQEQMKQTGHWLSGEIERLRNRVAEAEARVEEFRGKNNLHVGSNNTSLSAQQLAEVNTQIVQARAQRSDAETKAKMIREMLKVGKPIEASDIVNSDLIRRLNEQRITLQAQLAEQSSTLLDQHPRIKELKAQVADLEAQTRTEAAKLARSFENDAKMAAARADAMTANLEQLKTQASALGAEDVQLRALDREARAQRELLETFLARYRDVTSREDPGAIQPDARVLSQAVPAPTPYFPKKLPIILIAMLATVVTAATLIILAELMSADVVGRAARPVEDSLPTELAAPAPSWIGKRDVPAPVSVSMSIEQPQRPAGQRLSAIADHAQSLGRGILVVTPSEPEAPAAEVALELARELGQRGGRVLLLNFDVGESVISGLVADPRKPGLADLLFGVAHFGEVIQRDRASRAHVIPVGRGIRDTAALLGGERLAVVLGALSQTYDHIVAAAPALMQLPKAERLARFSRGALLVAPEGREDAGSAASDALSARGFASVAVVTVAPEPIPPSTSADRAAA